MPVRGVPRRTLAEIEQRYVFEPTLRDLYVEGAYDKRMYDWYLKARGYHNVAVFDIGTIDIGQDILETHGLVGGNRARTIALALELDRRFANPIPNVRCVADADFDFISQTYRSANHLLYTDYTSLDLYAFDERTMGKLTVASTLSEDDIRSILQNIIPILKELFIARAASAALDLRAQFPNFLRYCALENGLATFMRDACFENWLNSRGLAHRKQDFERMCAQLRSIDIPDVRMCIRGRDYLELLGWLLRRRSRQGGNHYGPDEIQRLLSMAFEADRLSQEHLFMQIELAFGQPLPPTVND